LIHGFLFCALRAAVDQSWCAGGQDEELAIASIHGFLVARRAPP